MTWGASAATPSPSTTASSYCPEVLMFSPRPRSSIFLPPSLHYEYWLSLFEKKSVSRYRLRFSPPGRRVVFSILFYRRVFFVATHSSVFFVKMIASHSPRVLETTYKQKSLLFNTAIKITSYTIFKLFLPKTRVCAVSSAVDRQEVDRVGTQALAYQVSIIINITIHSSCEIEDFVESSSLQAVCDTPIARITSCVSSLRI